MSKKRFLTKSGGSAIDAFLNSENQDGKDAFQASFRLLADSAPTMIWVSSVDKRCVYFNRRWLEFTGKTIEQELGDGWTGNVHPDDLQDCLEIYERNFEKRVEFEIEYRLRRHDDQYRLILDCCVPFYDLKGEFKGFIGSCIDITERRKAEEHIRHQASLLDQTSDAILVSNLNYQIIYWNKGAELLYGLSAEEVYGKDVCDVVFSGDESLLSAAQNAIASADEWKMIVRQTLRGVNKIFSCRWKLVRDEHRQPDYILINNRDVTEQKQIEEQLLRAQRMESIGTLAGGIAHDLNNILAPILITTEMLEMEVFDHTTMNRLNLIKECAERGADLIKQVLTFAKGFKGERVTLHLESIIKDLTSILRQTFQKNITIKTLLKPDLWLISADSTQIRQILLNLSLNARDAMENGGILKISAENVLLDENYARMHVEARAGKYVLITISDTGTGIPREIQNRIFDPFFTTKETGKGTGLGLSTTLSIIKSHNGFINVYSSIGKGTKFAIYLPAAEPADFEELQSRQALYPKGAGETILLVDDEESILNINREMLEKFDYRVLTACDGADAIAIYAKKESDVALVITDLAMPNLDGAGLIRVLRRINPESKIIAVSGITSGERTAELQTLNVNAFLSKPYSAEKMLGTITELLHH